MLSQSERPLALLAAARLIPLLTIERVEDAVPLAKALVDGGLATMEIALRTPAAPHAIRQIVRHVPAAIPAAGNVMTPRDLALAQEVGAHFALSPGSSPALLDAAAAGSLPFVPGIATPTELMQVMSKGFHVVKYFPSVPFGGPAASTVARSGSPARPTTRPARPPTRQPGESSSRVVPCSRSCRPSPPPSAPPRRWPAPTSRRSGGASRPASATTRTRSRSPAASPRPVRCGRRRRPGVS